MLAASLSEAEAIVAKTPVEKAVTAVITPPNLQTGIFKIMGDSPYVQHKFSEKARKEILDKQVAGSQSQSRKKRAPRDLDADYKSAMHISEEGWIGIPAPAFRNAMIGACRLVNFKMVHAKISIFILADGIDAEDGTPLVKIDGEPERHEGFVRISMGGTSVVQRPMWRRWTASLKIEWDGDQFSLTDVSNLLERAGRQVGIGEGRNSSPNSNGLGWGSFHVAEKIPATAGAVVKAANGRAKKAA
jgi:hypothetical protein